MGLISRVFVQVAKSKGHFNLISSSASKLRFSTTTALGARKFTEKHEWVELNGKIGTIGISQYAQDSLGDIVYAQLPDVGSEFAIMEECGALESVKAASELYCPLTGKVTEKNTEVENTPGLINKSCYDKGWLFKLELTKPDEMKDLMDEAAYENF
jgi:glycine cleavage system H protein